MSGGHFGYKEFNIKQLAEEMQDAIDNNTEYSDAIIDKFKTAVDLLNLSYLYVKMIDRLLSGDYSDDSFLSNLDKELTDLNDEKKESKESCLTIVITKRYFV